MAHQMLEMVIEERHLHLAKHPTKHQGMFILRGPSLRDGDFRTQIRHRIFAVGFEQICRNLVHLRWIRHKQGIRQRHTVK